MKSMVSTNTSGYNEATPGETGAEGDSKLLSARLKEAGSNGEATQLISDAVAATPVEYPKIILLTRCLMPPNTRLIHIQIKSSQNGNWNVWW